MVLAFHFPICSETAACSEAIADGDAVYDASTDEECEDLAGPSVVAAGELSLTPFLCGVTQMDLF